MIPAAAVSLSLLTTSIFHMSLGCSALQCEAPFWPWSIRIIYSLRAWCPWVGVELPNLIATCPGAVAGAVAIPFVWIETIIWVTRTGGLTLG